MNQNVTTIVACTKQDLTGERIVRVGRKTYGVSKRVLCRLISEDE